MQLSLKDITIRLATSWDIDTIMEVAKKSKELNKVGFLTRNDVDYCINVKNQAKFYVATDDTNHHKVIGFIYGFVEVPSFACLMYLCVDKEFRNIGIGKRLVNYFVSDMKIFGVDKIYCLTTTENVSVFFNQNGFDYTGQVLGYMERKVSDRQNDEVVS